MSDVELLNLESGYNVSRINRSFDIIEEAINTDLLNLSGGNNTMLQELDMNSNRIINLPEPVDNWDAVPKGYLDDLIGHIIESGEYPPVQIDLTGGEDYVMSSDEALAKVKFILNGSDGQRLIYPASIDELIPTQQTLLMVGPQGGLVLFSEDSGNDLVIQYSPLATEILYIQGLGIYQVNSGVKIPIYIPDTTYTISEKDNNSVLVFTSDTQVNIEAELPPGGNCTLVQLGLGRLFISHEGGSPHVHGYSTSNGRYSVVFVRSLDDVPPEDEELPSFVLTGDLATDTNSVALNSPIDLQKGDYFIGTLTDNSTLEFDNVFGARSVVIQITQTSPAKTLTWPASFKWAGGTVPSVSTTNGAKDLLGLTTFDGGFTWQAVLSKGFA